MTPILALTVAVAGAVGATIRYLLTLLSPTHAHKSTPSEVPGGVLMANLVGSAVAGVCLGLAERSGVSGEWMLILATGFCGGLTTFSTFSVETVQLAQQGSRHRALANIALTLLGGFGVAFGAYLLAR